MSRPQDKNRLFATIAAVAASVFLFACGGTERVEPGSVEATPPARPTGPAEASLYGDGASSPAAGTPRPTAGTRVGETEAPTSVDWPAAPAPEPSFGTQVAQEVASREAATPLDRPSRGRVFSNKDLERYRELKKEFGFRDGVVVVDLTQKPVQDDAAVAPGMTAADLEAETRATRDRLTALIQELEYQKKRVLPLQNPFVPRPQISDQDKLDEAGMDNVERLNRVKRRIGEIEGEMNTMQRRLAELQNMKPVDQRGEPGAAPARNEE